MAPADALVLAHGNRTRAARAAGLGREAHLKAAKRAARGG